MNLQLNWPGIWGLFVIFALLNLRGITLYVRGYRPAAFGLICLWLLAAMFLELVRERIHAL